MSTTTSFTVITMESAELQSEQGKKFTLHHRFPVIFTNTEDAVRWLDTDKCNEQQAIELLKKKCPQSIDSVCWHRVSMIVNNTRNNVAECMQELPAESDSVTGKRTKISSTKGRSLEQFGFKRIKREPVEDTASDGKSASMTVKISVEGSATKKNKPERSKLL